MATLGEPASARTFEPSLDPDLVVDRWTTEDGLPLDHAADVAQGADGSIWVATYDGLARMDGDTVEVMRRDSHPDLPTNRFIAIHGDDAGRVWTVSEDGSILRHTEGEGFHVWHPGASYRGDARAFVTWQDQLYVTTTDGLLRIEDGAPVPWHPDGVRGHVSDLVVDAGGATWVGTLLHGIHRVDPSGAVTTPYAHEDTGMVSALMRDDRGAILALAPDRLLTLDGGGLGTVEGPALTTGDVDEDARLCGLIQDDAGRVLLYGMAGWWRVDGREATPLPWPGVSGSRCLPASGRAIRHDGAMWYAAGRTLLRDGQPIHRLASHVNRLLQDRRGDLWVAANGGGLLRVRTPVLPRVLPPDPRLARNARAAVVHDDGRAWVLLEPDPDHPDEPPIVRVDPDGSLTDVTIPPASEGRQHHPVPGMLILLEGDDTPWATWPGGLCQVDGGRCIAAPLPELLSDHLEEPNLRTLPGHREVWLDSRRGLYRAQIPPGGRLDATARWQEVEHAESDRLLVNQVVALPDGSRLLATHHGLWQVASGHATHLLPDRFPSMRVRGVHADPAGWLWTATEDAGLCVVMPPAGAPLHAADVRCLTRAHGLFDDNVHAVIPDDRDRLWIPTNRGVFYVQRADALAILGGEADHLLSMALGEQDGMPSAETNGTQSDVALDRDGRLWVPTQRGVTVFDPDRVQPEAEPPVVSRLLLHPGPAWGPTAAVHPLRSDQTRIGATWSTAELTWPEQLRFRYRVAGVEERWSAPTTARQAAWSGLPPGEGVVQVQAGIAGAWGPIAAIPFTRAPALQETWGFRFGLGLAALALAVLLIEARSRALRASNQRLESVVEDRTREIAERNDDLRRLASQLSSRNEEIRRQADRLRELDTLRTQMVANVSHELRTPLTLALGAVETLSADARSPRERKNLDVLARNVDRLRRLVDEVMDAARLQTGQLPLRARRADLRETVHGICRRFAGRADDDGVELTTHDDGEPLFAWFDPDLVDKIVANLVGNALKFTPRGGAITVEIDETDDGLARVRVRDTGVGIAAADRERIFERFFQGEMGDRRRFGGAGIGLALARELAQLHGGDLTVSSRVDEGSTFTFTLPLGSDHLQPDELDLEGDGSGNQPAILPRPTPSATGRPWILVVEDHPELREWLADQLGAWADVQTASDGREALEVARAHKPDLIVTDVMMPHVDGLDLCARIRADEALADVPLLVVSARTKDTTHVEALRVADDFLAKPFTLQDLRQRVGRLVHLEETPPPSEEGLSEVDRQFLDRLDTLILDHLDDSDVNVTWLAKKMALSRRQFQREVQRLTGRSPVEHLRDLKLREARALLERGAYSTVAEVAAAVGMSPRYLRKVYQAWFGRPPSEDLKR